MRENLKQARKNEGMTQQQMADYLHITLRYYKKLESGDADGSITLWDSLEDLFEIPQRLLREIPNNHPCQADSQ